MGFTCIRIHSIYVSNTSVPAIIFTNGCRTDCKLIARCRHMFIYSKCTRYAKEVVHGDPRWSCCTCQHNSISFCWTSHISCQYWCGWFVWGWIQIGITIQFSKNFILESTFGKCDIACMLQHETSAVIRLYVSNLFCLYSFIYQDWRIYLKLCMKHIHIWPTIHIF